MKSPAGALCVGLACLLAAGCGNPQGGGGGQQPEAAPPGDEIAQTQRVKELIGTGKKALDEKRFDAAATDLAEAVKLRDDPEARELLQQARKAAYEQAVQRGHDTRQAKDYPAAIAAFRDALRHRPDDKDATTALKEAEFHDFLTRGRAELEGERYAEAVKTLAGAVQRRPDDDTDSRDLLKQAQTKRRVQVMGYGQTALAAKQYADAARHFGEAKELSPDAEVTALFEEASFQAKLQSGRQRVEGRQFAAAIPELEEAVRLRPDHAGAREALQQAKEGKKVQDRADYDRSLSAGRSALEFRRYDDAIRELQKAKQLMPAETEAGRLLTQAEGKKRDYERQLSSGKSALDARRYDDAIRDLRAADLLGPPGSEAARLISQAEGKKRDYERQLNSGRLALAAGRYDDAIRDLRAADQLGPFGSEAGRLLREAEAKKREPAANVRRNK